MKVLAQSAASTEGVHAEPWHEPQDKAQRCTMPQAQGALHLCKKANSAPCLVVTKSGDFVFVGNNGHNSIATIAVDEVSGILSARGHLSMNGMDLLDLSKIVEKVCA